MKKVLSFIIFTLLTTNIVFADVYCNDNGYCSGTIDRVLSKVKFETTSEQARQKLKSELNNLNFAVDTMLLAMEGE